MESINYRLQLHGYGPFELPEKREWVIVGSGPTAEKVLAVPEDVGIITLNAELPGIHRSTVHIVGHYEYYLQCVNELDRAEIVFFANPMHVGFRCQPIPAVNLLDFNYLEERYPGKFRFFEKEMDKEKLALRDHTLYCVDTLASTALHLLKRAGVKNASYCGIDGYAKSISYGRSTMFREFYKIREPNGRLDPGKEHRYDDERKAFLEFGKWCGIELKDLSDVPDAVSI